MMAYKTIQTQVDFILSNCTTNTDFNFWLTHIESQIVQLTEVLNAWVSHDDQRALKYRKTMLKEWKHFKGVFELTKKD